MTIHITLRSTLFSDNHEQEVRVRTDLTVGQLIAEIAREYSLSSGNYCLTLDSAPAPLPEDQTLQQAGVRTGAVLVFGTNDSNGDRPSGNKGQPRLRAASGETFELRRQPSLIGRPNNHTRISSEMLDADLSVLDPDRTSSRPHARITCIDAEYYLESIRDDNPAYVGEQPVAPGTRRRLSSGEWLRFGVVRLQFLIGE